MDKQTRLLVGLGNPEKKYTLTRHNVGFLVIDALAKEFGIELSEQKKTHSLVGVSAEHNTVLAEPLTYMNESGKAIGALMNFYNIETQNLVVIHDEVDLPFGTIRVSKNSGSAGHKGVESVLGQVGKNFARIRVGIEGRPDNSHVPTDDYVLQNFQKNEIEELKLTIIPKVLELLRHQPL